MEIKSYYVGSHRQRNASNYQRRWISLVPKTPTSTVQNIVIYFFVGETITNDTDIGYVTPTSTKFVVAYAPISDFADMYHIYWYADAANKVQWFQITTNEEPIGEGPRDLTGSFTPVFEA